MLRRLYTKKNIVVVGTGYAGLSTAVLLSQHNKVTAVDINEDTKNKISTFDSPIKEEYIEKFFGEVKNGERKHNLSRVVNGKDAYKASDFVVMSVPTNYDSESESFDCTKSLKEKHNYQKILFI